MIFKITFSTKVQNFCFFKSDNKKYYFSQESKNNISYFLKLWKSLFEKSNISKRVSYLGQTEYFISLTGSTHHDLSPEI